MKKLTLSKEQLRVLTSREVEQVAGAGPMPVLTQSPLQCYSITPVCQSRVCETRLCIQTNAQMACTIAQ